MRPASTRSPPAAARRCFSFFFFFLWWGGGRSSGSSSRGGGTALRDERTFCLLVAFCFAACYRQLLELAVLDQRQPTRHPVAGILEEEATRARGHERRDIGTGGARQHASKRPVELDSSEEAPEPKMAACLLVMDDNHWLIEWVAYHYHVLPLDELVYMHDPQSRTSPRSILSRWEGRVQISRWSDEEVIKPWVLKQHRQGNITQARLHRYRQQFFYSRCMRHYQEEAGGRDSNKKTWLLLSDTDEFVRPNPYYMNGQGDGDGDGDGDGSAAVDLSERGCVRSYLQRQLRSQQQDINSSAADPAVCLHIPRIQISTRADDDGDEPRGDDHGEKHSPDLPSPTWNASHFLTIAWLYHGGREITTGHNLDGKNIVQLGGGRHIDIPTRVANVHHVLPEHCPGKVDGARSQSFLTKSWLLIYHYGGTFEQYTFRGDPRNAIPGRPARNFKQWQSLGRKQQLSGGASSELIRDASMRSWLKGFVATVGMEEAERLLKGVGKLEAA